MSDFTLNRGDMSDGFAARCRDIFGGLLPPPPGASTASTTTDKSLASSSSHRSRENKTSGDRSTTTTSTTPPTAATSDFRGRESIFRVNDIEGFAVPRQPQHRPQRTTGDDRPRVPREQVPRRRNYTKYSLADVDISDRSNARAAFDFLKEQRDRKSQQEAEAIPADAKITFKRPTAKQPATDEGSSSSSGQSSSFGTGGKRVLPECVVGGGGSKFNRPQKRKIVTTDDDDNDDDKKESEPAAKLKKKSKTDRTKLSFALDEDEDDDA